MEGRKRELLLRCFAVLRLACTFKQVAEVLCAGLQLLLAVAGHRGHCLAPGGLALPDLLYQVDGGRGHEGGRIVEELGLEKREFQDVLGEVLVLGLEADDLAQRLEEFVGRVDYELKVEVLYNARLHL